MFGALKARNRKGSTKIAVIMKRPTHFAPLALSGLSLDTPSELLGYYHSSALRTDKPTSLQSRAARELDLEF